MYPKFMQRFFSLLLLGLLFFLAPQTVLAHVLKSDGSVGAVVHISPDDDPVAGEQSSFYFEFKDKEGKFDPQKCFCSVSILQSDKEIFTQSLFTDNNDPSLKNASFSFTFPERNIYQIKISGKPQNGEFSPFELRYDIRVEKTANSSKNPDKQDNWFWAHAVHLAGGFLLGGFLVFALIAQKRKKVAVIILALFLVGHSLPVKAIHAAHDGPVNTEAFACCLPASAIIPVVLVFNSDLIPEKEEIFFKTSNFKFQISDLHSIRPPPLS